MSLTYLTLDITAGKTISVFPTRADIDNWRMAGAFHEHAKMYNGINIDAIAGIYPVNRWYPVIGNATVYIKDYDTPRLHPRIPFAYEAWAVIFLHD